MNKYRILTAALSSKATVDDFTFCRSSDLLLFTCLPTLLYIQACLLYTSDAADE